MDIGEKDYERVWHQGLPFCIIDGKAVYMLPMGAGETRISVTDTVNTRGS